MCRSKKQNGRPRKKQKLQKEALELGLTYEDYKKQIEQNRVHEGLLSF
ncbi:hypothetical protein Yangon179_12890 [Helicobacter pylori]